MKQYINILAIMSVMLCSCEKELITIDQEIIELHPDFTSGDFLLSLSTKHAWTATASEDWIKPSPSSGDAGKTDLTILFSENPTYEKRQASITITSNDVVKTVTVIQPGRKGIALKNDSNVFEIGYEGGNIEIPVGYQGNVSCTYHNGCSSWIHYVDTKSLTNGTATLIIDKNDNTYARSGAITLNAGKDKVSIVIKQGVKEYLDLKKDTYEIKGSQSYLQCELSASTDVKAFTENDWIKISYECSYFVSLIIDANTSNETRTGTVTINTETISKEITIVQSPLVVSLSYSEDTLSPYEGEFKIIININDDKAYWTAKPKDKWIRSVSTNGDSSTHGWGYGSATTIWEAEKNNGEKRDGQIIITVYNMEYSVYIHQASSNAYYENGMYAGEGIPIVQMVGNTEKTVVWAPVNCGYSDKYNYGKLYQWGRKDGQGYSKANGRDESNTTVTVKMTTASSAQPLKSPNKNTFYTDTGWWHPHDWYTIESDYQLIGNWYWISTQDNTPIDKSKIDEPCPEGWRLPTESELQGLIKNHSYWTSNNGQRGYYFCGNKSWESSSKAVFLPAAGRRVGGGNAVNSGNAEYRNNTGYYWSTNTKAALDPNYGQFSHYEGCILLFYNQDIRIIKDGRSNGNSIRCVRQ